MFTLRSSEGVILSEGLTIPKAIDILNKAFRNKYQKVAVFQDNVYLCQYYTKG